MVKKQKHTILKGEGIHQHTLFGSIQVEEKERDFSTVIVTSNGVLKHEKPDGSFGEHKTLQVDKGKYILGKQIEYNPFRQTVSQVWD
jgi:hypothetical protein